MVGSPPAFLLPVFNFFHKNNIIRTHDQSAKGSDYIVLVDPKGFEPSVSALRTRRFPS